MNKLELPHRTLVFVAGGPGTGKTTLAMGLLSRVSKILYLPKDDIMDVFLSTPDDLDNGILSLRLNGPKIPITSDFYKNSVGRQNYKAMLQIAHTNLDIGLSCLLEGNYTGLINKGYFQEIVFPYFSDLDELKIKLLFCYADRLVMAERIKNRNAHRDAEKIASEQAMDDYLKSEVYIPERIEELDHLKVESTNEEGRNDKNVDLALEYLLNGLK